MNCDCISKMEKTIAEHMKSTAGEGASATCMSTGFGMMDSGLELIINIPFRIKGSNKGFTSEKGKTVNFCATYCPFCGVKTAKPQAEVAA